MDHFLIIDSVKKQYDGHLAVNHVSLHIPRNMIYGLLGPNGAGKTSIIRMITGITIPDSGSIIFDGEPLERAHLGEIGYMPEERGLYKKMKVKEQIVYLLSLKGVKTSKAKTLADEWLLKFDLDKWADKKVTDLSKGMQQKVQFISTVAHEPKLLILDEPFSGLDPVNTKILVEVIHELKDKGTTIIFSTHRMEQVEELCDSIGLMNKGQLMLEDNITSVRKQFQRNQYHLDFVGDVEIVNEICGDKLVEISGKSALIQLEEGENPKTLLQAFINSELEILKFELHLPRLNEIFIELVKKAPEHE